MEYFNPISVVIQGTGAVFNSSKKHFIWRFELDQEEHSAELECSFLTNKRRVTFDGNLIYKGFKSLLTSDFSYQFKHKNHILTVFNHRNDANLIVDSLSFDLVYGQKIIQKASALRIKPKNDERLEKHLKEDNFYKNEAKKEEINAPKPARFISDEEYNQAISLSDKFVAGPTKSLREILEKNQNQGKSPKGVFERDVVENKDFFGDEVGGRKDGVRVDDDFLNLDDADRKSGGQLEKEQGGLGLIDFGEVRNETGIRKHTSMKVMKPSPLGQDFLEVDNPPSSTDLLSINPSSPNPDPNDLLFLNPSPSGQTQDPFLPLSNQPEPSVNLNLNLNLNLGLLNPTIPSQDQIPNPSPVLNQSPFSSCPK